MSDQAETLRKLMVGRAPARPAPSENHAPVITISSGKGGVGKSCLAANLATLLARSGSRILLVDGDLGLANLDILLGVSATVTLEQVLDGDAKLQEAVVGIEPGLWLLPASSGIFDLRSGDEQSRLRLSRLFENCPWEMDAIIVDVGAGIQKNVLSLHSPTYKSVIVVTPEPTSLTDSYALMKLLRRRSGISEFSIVVNQVTDGREARQAFQKLKDVAARFMDVRLDYLGHWGRDEKSSLAVMKRKILIDLDKGAASIPSLELLAKTVSERFLGRGISDLSVAPDAMNGVGNTSRFWKSLLTPMAAGT